MAEKKEETAEIVEKLIEAQVKQTRKEEVLDIYEGLLQTIWNRILPTLGGVTVVAIMERAIALTKPKYPLAGYLQVKSKEVDFSKLKERVIEEKQEDIQRVLKEVVANLIDILTMLTGDILVHKLLGEIEKKGRVDV